MCDKAVDNEEMEIGAVLLSNIYCQMETCNGATVSAFCFPHLMMYFSLDTLLLAGASVAVCSALCLRILPAGRD